MTDSATEQEEKIVEDSQTGGSDDTQANSPAFASLTDTGKGPKSSLQRFHDVQVTVSAQLGSVSMPLGEVLQFAEGSVIELSRSVNEPVDLMAQGVRIARGEVVVVDDCFAIRIKEIEESDSGED